MKHPRYSYEPPDMLRSIFKGRFTSHMLSKAGFRLHVQPQVDRHHALWGAEALLRLPANWPFAGGLQAFLQQAERTHAIHALGDWVLEEACSLLNGWKTTGLASAHLAINASPTQLLNERFVTKVAQLLSDYSLEACRLEVEITETVFLDVEKIAPAMHTLSGLGVTFAVDDFGIGFSSLQHLVRLPIRVVKIDRFFVQRMLTQPSSYMLLRSLISMAHGLNLRTVAEGIETEEQRKALFDLGCDAIQGYLISPPLEPSAFAARVQDREGHTPVTAFPCPPTGEAESFSTADTKGPL